MVVSHAEGCKVDSLLWLRLTRFILCTRRSGGTDHEGGDCTSQLDLPSESKGKVFYCQEPPSGEFTTTECGVNYQLFAVITEVA